MGPSRPQSSEALVRKGHLTGLKPVVLVTFQSPVNFHRWKIEQLQIQMEAAPFRSPGGPGGSQPAWWVRAWPCRAWPCGAWPGKLNRVPGLKGPMTWWGCGGGCGPHRDL